MLLKMVGFGAITGIFMTVFVSLLEWLLAFANDDFVGMTGTMIGGGFSAQTLAFLMTATSLSALLALFFEKVKTYVATVYDSIVFGIGFLLGGFSVAFIISTIFFREGRLTDWCFPGFIIITLVVLLFAVRYAVISFEKSQGSRAMWWITVLGLVTIAFITIPIIHLDLKRQEIEAARSGKPEPG